MTKITCDDCISQNVCQYKKVYEETTVNSEHPYLLISCTEYRSNIIEPIITNYKDTVHYCRAKTVDCGAKMVEPQESKG